MASANSNKYGENHMKPWILEDEIQVLVNLFKDKNVRIILRKETDEFCNNDIVSYYHANDLCKLINYDTKHMTDWKNRWNIKLFSYENLRDSNYKINFENKKTDKKALFINYVDIKKVLLKVNTYHACELIEQINIKPEYKYVRKEIEIIKNLEDFFITANIKYSLQFKVNNYRIDILLNDYNIGIEIDEFNHNGRNKEYETYRQNEIEKYKIKILRFNPDDKEFNINMMLGIIVKNIINKNILNNI